jgi:sec-independent protein translocase protein TatC
VDRINSSESSELNELINKYSPYLFEVRKRIILTLIIFAAAAIVGFVFYEKIIKFLIEFLSLKGINIVFTSPFQFINLAVSCGVATGLIFTFPLIIYQIFSFLKPALKKQEYKIILRFLPFSIVLFFMGFSFGLFIMKWQIQLFLAKSISLGIGNILDISNLISIVLLVAVIMGFAFQFPLIILLLMRIGLIKPSDLNKQRMWVYLGSLMFVFLLPVDSIIADILLVLPIIVLFEATLILNILFEKKKH